jgi:hypothetical protein
MRLSSLPHLIRLKEREIDSAKQAPRLLRLPLPATHAKAAGVLFFAHMPDLFQSLSRMSMMAQQVLLPSNAKLSSSFSIVTKPDMDNMVKRMTYKPEGCPWQSYHDDQSAPDYQNAAHPWVPTKVEFFATGTVPDKNTAVSPYSSNVMHYKDENAGVWHPDELGTIMMWSGGTFDLDTLDGSYFNPWSVGRATRKLVLGDDLIKKMIVDGLTEKDASLQRPCFWTLPQYGNATASNRGNKAVAEQHLKPKWLSKPEWLAFAVLRAYPHQQLRKLLNGLHEELLPLEHPAVRTMTGQLLGHLGALSNEATPRLLWKTDQIKGRWCSQIASELDRLQTVLHEKPRQFKSILLLAEISEYVSQWYPESRVTSRKLSLMADRLANEILSSIQDADPNFTHEFRSKCCLLQMYAVVCHLRGDLIDTDADLLVRLRVQVTNGMLFQKETQYDGELKSAAQLCDLVMSRRVDNVAKCCGRNNFASLTTAVRTVIQDTPIDLVWQSLRVESPQSIINPQAVCFEAVDESHSPSCHYCINVLTGTVLLNGHPPSQLPREILDHPLYRRSFGDRTFEVCTMTPATNDSSGKLKTTGAVKGRFYTFELALDSKQLLVQEILPTSEGDLVLELLEIPDVSGREMTGRLLPRTPAAGWSDELPIRLRDMHSHWHNLATNVILLRGKIFGDRNTSYLLCGTRCQGGAGGRAASTPWQCLRVPEHRQTEEWAVSSLKDGLDRLVVHRSAAVAVLNKFEKLAFVHTYFECGGEGQELRTLPFKVEMPRFGLAFRSSGSTGQLHSLQYVGYHLARNQQLRDTIVGFQQYLVLKRTRADGQVGTAAGETKILVPRGALLRTCDSYGSSVRVEVSTRCSETILHHAYTVHPRFRDLRATSVESRLQLAAIYAMTGSLVYDQRVGMLGGEFAMELVRKCSTDRPLSQSEQGQLQTVSHSCHRTPGLALLCRDLELNSAQLAFMYPDAAPDGSELTSVLHQAYRHAVTEYLSSNRVWRFRGRLFDVEERRLLGDQVRRRPRTFTINSRAPISVGSVEIKCGPLSLDFVEQKEKILCKLIQTDEVVMGGAVRCTKKHSQKKVDGRVVAWGGGSVRAGFQVKARTAANSGTLTRASYTAATTSVMLSPSSTQKKTSPKHKHKLSQRERCRQRGELTANELQERGSVEYRIDIDNNAYLLDSFIEVYGGSIKKPPRQWTQATRAKGNGWHCPNCTLINSPISAVCDTCKHHLYTVSRSEPQATDKGNSGGELPPFPITGSGSTPVAEELMDDLEVSWNAHHRMAPRQLGPGYDDVITSMRCEVLKAREATEAYILTSLVAVPNSASSLAPAFRMQRLVNVVPKPILADLVRASWDESVVPHFNPFLTQKAHTDLRHFVLLWEKLCVLEDKLARLSFLLLKPTSSGTSDLLLQELESRRMWDTYEHPRWLAFELEFGLQIRPKQHFVAQRMIDSSTAGDGVQPVVQLNMGEGKTRVILPMLALYFGSKGKLPRLTVLSSILKEAQEYLHEVLTASLQGCAVCALPFVRDVDVNKHRLDAISRCLERCRKSCGALVVAPEHRQSLYLKGVELLLRLDQPGESSQRIASDTEDSACSKRLLALQREFAYVDVLDECDEVLRPTTKLVYTHGDHVQLPSLSTRCDMTMAVLRVVNMDESVDTLDDESLVLEDLKWPGGFRAVRLIPGVPFEHKKSEFLTKVATLVLTDPEPLHSLRWTNELEKQNKHLFHAIIEFVATSNTDDAAVLEASIRRSVLSETQIDAVYMLRGLLSHDLLVHCLQKRYRVNFGIKPNGSKRIAVPFHGSDTPAPRAEFAHPDCGLMFTLLSYFNSGLTVEQLRQSFETLLGRGGDAQHAIYSRWLAASRPQMDARDVDTIDTITKIDLSNSQQLEMIRKYFAGNTYTVGFWLMSHVFCEEMIQFPFRIEATAWDLAQSPHRMVMGFSGTKDNRLLFPTQLTFLAPTQGGGRFNESLSQELLGTDGKMIHLIGTQATYHQLFGQGCEAVAGDAGNWERALRYVTDAIKAEESEKDVTADGSRTTALIDAGAMMAGKSNLEVADFILNNTTPRSFRGVVYFNLKHGEWRVRDHQGAEWSKSSSPIHEREAFVYFDECRCRGADMKLEQTARAVLCNGPVMQKDKFMQAAARLRQLSRGQKITLIAPRDVDSQIREFNHLKPLDTISPLHIVSWTLMNSENSVASSIPEFSNQGLRFCAVADKPKLAIIPEILDLKSLYSSSNVDLKAYEVWLQKKELDMQDRGANGMPAATATLVSLIDQRMCHFGSDIQVEAATLDQECERELEKEIELEQERQVEVAAQKPRSEETWDYSALRNAGCNRVEDLPRAAKVQSLQSFVNKRLDFGAGGSSLSFSPCLYGTNNFFESCEGAFGPRALNKFLRWVDTAIQLPCGHVVLLSEREADAILGEMFAFTSSPPKFQFLSIHELYGISSDKHVAASLRLFRGETMCPPNLRSRLQGVLTGEGSALGKKTSEHVARAFVNMRGRFPSWDRSDLEKVATTFTFLP